MVDRDFREVLIEQGARVGVVLPAAVVEGCATHYALMVRWNATHNLTRVSSPEEAAVRHYLDCAIPAIALTASVPERFLDIGSGAGFPGLVAGLVWAGVEAGLVEPARKRASFLAIAAGAMGVRAVVHAPGPLQAPLVLSRATFSDGAREELWPYVERGGRLVVWSTTHELPAWERAVSTWESAMSTVPYALPGLEGRLLVVVHRSL